jgi:hypothetical protein
MNMAMSRMKFLKAMVSWPDLFATMNTWKKRKVDNNLCMEEFAMLYHYTDEHGHVPDEVFESHGFPVDSVENGETVRCPAGITQEHLQIAKNLSHEEQKKLQRKRKDRTMRKQQNKPVEEKLRILHILEDDHLDGEALLELVGGPETSARQILVQTEPEQLNNKRCKFLLSQGLVPSHVCPPLTLPCSFIVGLTNLLKAFIHA